MDPDARDANGYLYSGYPSERAKTYQKLLNESWPEHYPNGAGHARNVKTQPNDKRIPVTVRIVWECDGEEFREGVADRWTATHVHVSLGDQRLQVPGIWVLAADVRRR